MPGKPYDTEAIFKQAEFLLDMEHDICFESILIDLLGVGKSWFYENLMKNPEYSDTIKEKIRHNRGRGVLKGLRNLSISDAPACIISRLKILNSDIRDALSDKMIVSDSPSQIVVNVGQDEKKIINLGDDKNGDS